MTNISPHELPSILKKPKTLLLDVREREDFEGKGLNIPPHEILERLAELDPYENIVLVCAFGTISEIIARLLQKKLPSKKIFFVNE